MKTTVEIEDSLQDRVDGAIEEVKNELLNYLKENEPSSLPDLGDLDDSGTVHEIVDGSVPIYTKEIEDTWYLHARELEEAYENAGCGTNPRENDGMSAIYFFIDQEVRNWYFQNAEDIFDEWENGPKEVDREGDTD